MWETFRFFVLEGYTLRRIRKEMLERGHDLTEYDDPTLLRRMLIYLHE